MKRVLKALLPHPVVRAIQEALTLPAAERGVYFRTRILRALGLRRDRLPADPRSGPVVFICHGNIIRSAMAEAFFRRAMAAGPAPAIRTESAGLFAKDGREPDPRAAVTARALGAPLTSHQARRLTEAMTRDASLLVVMDHRNEAVLLHRFPWAAGKVALLGGLAHDRDPMTGLAISDPFEGSAGDVRASGERIVRCVERLARDLQSVAANRA
jgi:protein-tyrosine phosphatase